MTNSDNLGVANNGPEDPGVANPDRNRVAIQTRVSEPLAVAVDELRGERSKSDFFRRCVEQVIAGEAVKQDRTDLLPPLAALEPDRKLWTPGAPKSNVGDGFDAARDRARAHHEADKVLKAGCAHQNKKMTGYAGWVCPDCHSILGQPDVNPNFK